MQCVIEFPKSRTSSSFFYLFPEGPDGILSVFCKPNLLAGTLSADWDKLMLRFLKNSNPPPLELGSCDYTQGAVWSEEDATWCVAWQSRAMLQLTWAVGVDGGVSHSPEPMAFRNRIMCRHRSHLPCSRAVLKRRVACCLLTAGTSMF